MIALENGHDGVTNELIDMAILCHDLSDHYIEIPVEQTNYLVGWGLLRNGSKAEDIDEDHRCLLHLDGHQRSFIFLAVHKIQHVLIYIHPQDIIFLDRLQSLL